MKATSGNQPINVRVEKTQARFKRIRNPEGRDGGVGDFLLVLGVAAVKEDVFIPISIASGKKPTGFVYQIEGTGEGTISTTDISVKGDGVTQITSGTILYAKIPAGKTATFRIMVEMRGWVGKSYRIVINRIHYKRDMHAARYEKYLKEVSSKSVKFG